jgi:hypothetical protein
LKSFEESVGSLCYVVLQVSVTLKWEQYSQRYLPLREIERNLVFLDLYRRKEVWKSRCCVGRPSFCSDEKSTILHLLLLLLSDLPHLFPLSSSSAIPHDPIFID